MIDDDLEYELLRNAEVLNVVLLRDATRQLILSSDHMTPIAAQLRSARRLGLDADPRRHAAARDARERDDPRDRPAGERRGPLIEITMPTEPLRMALIDYGLRILALSAFISVVTAALCSSRCASCSWCRSSAWWGT
jgi:hypothetical protein